MFAALLCGRSVQGCLDNYKQQLVGDPIIHTHLTALYGKQQLGGLIALCCGLFAQPPAGTAIALSGCIW